MVDFFEAEYLRSSRALVTVIIALSTQRHDRKSLQPLLERANNHQLESRGFVLVMTLQLKETEDSEEKRVLKDRLTLINHDLKNLQDDCRRAQRKALSRARTRDSPQSQDEEEELAYEWSVSSDGHTHMKILIKTSILLRVYQV